MSTNGLRIVDLRSQKKGQIKIVDKQGCDVANVLARHPDCDELARWFAAAPELLAAADLALDCYETESQLSPKGAEQLRAAIAKARGNV